MLYVIRIGAIAANMIATYSAVSTEKLDCKLGFDLCLTALNSYGMKRREILWGGPMSSVAIFGSCISRDIIDAGEGYDNPIVVAAYVARQSCVSTLLPSACCDIERINLQSSFQKRIVGWDLNKQAFSELEKNKADILIVDFFEERFDLGHLNGTYITLSNEFLRSGIGYGDTKSWSSLDECFEEYGISYRKIFHIFIERLLEIYHPENILINRAYLSDVYIDLQGKHKLFPRDVLESNKRINKKIRQLYREFARIVPQARIMNLTNSYYGYEGNKWGLASTHYEDGYYKSAHYYLERVLSGSSIPASFRFSLLRKKINRTFITAILKLIKCCFWRRGD